MAVIDGTFVDRVTKEAREVRFWRTLLTAIGAVLYGIGWLIGKAFTVVWLVVTWTFAAARVGFREARKPAGDG